MTGNISDTNTVATISRKELWALFVGHAMQTALSMGPAIKTYKPDDLLRDPGEWGDLRPFSEALADEVADDDDPAAALRQRIDEVESYLANLKHVRADFLAVADALFVDTDDEDENEDEAERYRMPNPFNGVRFIGDGSAPAAEHPEGFIGEDEDTGVGAPPA